MATQTLTVTFVNGDALVICRDEVYTVKDVMNVVKREFGIPKREQILVSGNTVLKPLDGLEGDDSHLLLFVSEPRCEHCGSASYSRPLRFCGGCRSVLYCGRACQSAHWSAHKGSCITASQTAIGV